MRSATTILASDFGTFFTASCLCLMGSSPGGRGEGERGGGGGGEGEREEGGRGSRKEGRKRV